MDRTERNIERILESVQHTPLLYDAVKRIETKVDKFDERIDCLETESAVCQSEHKNVNRRITGIVSVLVIALVAVLGLSAFAIEGWVSSKAEAKGDHATIVKTLP